MNPRLMRSHPVSNRVNQVENDDAGVFQASRHSVIRRGHFAVKNLVVANNLSGNRPAGDDGRQINDSWMVAELGWDVRGSLPT